MKLSFVLPVILPHDKVSASQNQVTVTAVNKLNIARQSETIN